MNLNLFIARRIGSKRDARGNPSRLSNKIATVSVAISILVMIVSIAVLGGFSKEIREKAGGFSGDMTLSTPGVDITNDQYPVSGDLSFLSKIDSLPFVKSIQAVSYRSGLLKTKAQIQGVIFKGVDSLYNLDFFQKYLYAGVLPHYGSALSNDILISKRLADMLGYSVGDPVHAYFIGEDVKVRKFTVSGIFDAQLEELDKVFVIADIQQIGRLNGWKNQEVSGFEILLADHLKGNFEKEEQIISNIVEENTGEEEDAVVALTTMRDTFYVLFDWLHLLDINVMIILVLMIAVAGVNMISGILIILFENVSQIGLLKAIGMKDADISKVFLLRASAIVAKGLLYGNVIAAVLCYAQWKYKFLTLDPANYFVKYVPVDISVTTVLLVDAAAFLVIMIILVVPCRFISKVNPATTLVYS
ncbi:MAG: FtsX-like permease family protein [Bacteroidales bacterium]